MKAMMIWLVVVLLGPALAGCGDDDSATPDGGGADGDADTDADSDTDTDTDTDTDADFSQLNGNSYILSVNRISDHPDVQFPFEELHEDNYVESTQGAQYEINFSDDIKTITIMSDVLISGEIETDDENRKNYSLTDGLFAGGRFNVWIVDKHFEAEFTVNGSGVPIIRSERGILEPAQ